MLWASWAARSLAGPLPVRLNRASLFVAVCSITCPQRSSSLGLWLRHRALASPQGSGLLLLPLHLLPRFWPSFSSFPRMVSADSSVLWVLMPVPKAWAAALCGSVESSFLFISQDKSRVFNTLTDSDIRMFWNSLGKVVAFSVKGKDVLSRKRTLVHGFEWVLSKEASLTNEC